MSKKKKSAAKAAPDPSTDPRVDEVDNESAPSDEEQDGKTSDRGATSTINADATLPARKEPSPLHESPSDSSASSSSDPEEALRANIGGDSGKPMKPEELAMLVDTEATARIVALREGRDPTPFSPGSALLAVSVANESMVSTAVPAASSVAVTAESTTAPKSSSVADNTVSLASSNSSAVVSSAAVGLSAVQTAGGSFPTLSSPPANPSASSATKSNLSLGSSTADVAAVTVTAADLRGVPRLNGSSDHNRPEILSTFELSLA